MLNETNISSRLDQEIFVCIKLESSTDSYKQFAEICILLYLYIVNLNFLYQIKVPWLLNTDKLVPVPSIFFIGENGVPVEIVTSDKAVADSLIPIIDNLITKKGTFNYCVN